MRSGKEHLAWVVMVEVRQRPLDTDHWKTMKEGRDEGREEGRAEGRQGGRKEATNRKSNNPHLAGGKNS